MKLLPSAHHMVVLQPVVLHTATADAGTLVLRNSNVRGVVNDTTAHAQKPDICMTTIIYRYTWRRRRLFLWLDTAHRVGCC